MSYYVEEDDLDLFDLNSISSVSMTEFKDKKREIDITKADSIFLCCVCCSNIGLMSEMQRNDHVNLCIQRIESSISEKKTVKDYFSKGSSSTHESNTPKSEESFNDTQEITPSYFIVEDPFIIKPTKTQSRRRSYSKKKDTYDDQIDVRNSILHTRFQKDCFKGMWTSTYFLSHCHSDHTGGLGKSFNKGKIYSTETTCRLAANNYSLPLSSFVFLEIGRRYFFTNVSTEEYIKVIRWIQKVYPDQSVSASFVQQNADVTDIAGEYRVVCVDVLEANHCPGACLFLFSLFHWTGDEANLFFTTLYSGDFRYIPSIIDDSVLRQYTRPEGNLINHVYVDNTYCKGKYKFPTQDIVINTVTYVLKKYYSDMLHALGNPLLVLFGAYTIGKEKVWLRVAQELNMKVYVDKVREQRIKCYSDYEQVYKSIITTDPSSTPLHVKGFASMKSVKEEQLHLKYAKVVIINPTGWVFAEIANKSDPSDSSLCNYTFRRSENIITYGFPYSEHSSFAEIQSFLNRIRYDTLSFIVEEQGAGDLLRELEQSTRELDIVKFFKGRKK